MPSIGIVTVKPNIQSVSILVSKKWNRCIASLQPFLECWSATASGPCPFSNCSTELDFWTHGAVSEDKSEQLKLTRYSPLISMWGQEDSCYEIAQGVSYRKRVWSEVKVQIRICTTTFWFCTWLHVAVCVLSLVFHEMRLECGSCTLPLVLSDSDGAGPIQVAAWLLKWVRPKHIAKSLITVITSSCGWPLNLAHKSNSSFFLLQNPVCLPDS